MDLEELKIAVVYCAPNVEDVTEVRLPPGSTVRDAIAAAGLESRYPIGGPIDAGIWGCRCPPDHTLSDGDRVEIYRPLIIDPKEARRLRVASRRGRAVKP